MVIKIICKLSMYLQAFEILRKTKIIYNLESASGNDIQNAFITMYAYQFLYFSGYTKMNGYNVFNIPLHIKIVLANINNTLHTKGNKNIFYFSYKHSLLPCSFHP